MSPQWVMRPTSDLRWPYHASSSPVLFDNLIVDSFPSIFNMSRLLTFLVVMTISSFTVATPVALVKNHEKTEPLKVLSQILGINERQSKRSHHPPPQYMLDLYYSTADDEGATKSQSPYNAKVIRSFSEKEQGSGTYFQFNITGAAATESVLEAELHVYRMRTSGLQAQVLKVYEMTDPELAGDLDENRLLDTRYVSGPLEGWEVFRVTKALAEWSNGANRHLGFLVVALSASGQTVPLRVSRRADRQKNRQPVLIMFNEDSAIHSNKDDDTKHESSRQRRDTGTQQNSSECHREEMYVDFADIGWSDWIIAPKGYNAYQCKGVCSFPLGQNQKPTNHATVQSIVHELHQTTGVASVNRPCCVPSRLISLSLLYYDENDNVILKQYNDMVAESCGCH